MADCKKPTGYVATCQHGLVRSDRKDAGKVLGEWIGKGCTLEPRLTGGWAVAVKVCEACHG